MFQPMMITARIAKALWALALGASLVLMAGQARAQMAMSPRQLRQTMPAAGTARGRHYITCPCGAAQFFEAFIAAQRPLLTCTDNASSESFVRLVASNIDLVVLFPLSGQLYCGWQPAGLLTAYLQITPAEFDVCRGMMIRAANREGVPCLPEL